MIIDERMVTYINSLDTGNGVFLDRLEQQAKKDDVPIIRREMQSFLKVLLQIKRPKRILEVGTAVGFSAILMCENTPEDTHITTIEKYEKRIPQAKENFRRPKRILEVGTAVGFSAILMCENTPEDTHITTIEKYEKRIPQAKENFRLADVEERITFLEGDALEILKELKGSFDFIFMDAAKGQYIHFLPSRMWKNVLRF